MINHSKQRSDWTQAICRTKAQKVKSAANRAQRRRRE